MVRVHELATELEVPSGKVLDVLKALGVEVKSHMSTISDTDVTKVKSALKSKKIVRGSSTLTGRRDFRVRDISSTSTKSPSVRPRPTMRQTDTGRRMTTRKVIKRVVRRGTQDDDSTSGVRVAPEKPHKLPAVPDIKKAVEDLDRKAEAKAAAEVAARKQATHAKGEHTRPSKPKPGRGDGRGVSTRKDRRRRDRTGPDVAERKTGKSEGRYAPVGKAGTKPDRKRPPKPQVPRIPKPADYLKPKEKDLSVSMEKLAAGGLKTKIDSSRGKGRGGKKPLPEKGGKRRKKIIKDDKKGKPIPQRGRGRSKRQQVQSQLDTSTTFRKRRRGRGGKRDRRDSLTVVEAAPKVIKLGEHISIKGLSAQTGLKSAEIISFLLKELEIFANINQTVDQEIGALICDYFNFEYEMQKVTEVEDVLVYEEDKEGDLMPRPPVVTVLGHVDHGKTKLLDAIRGTDVVSTETGGITQKIGAFKVDAPTKDGGTRAITFIDTPGHAAFTAMRARGAEVTDIAILVVAANDGVMPQTLEAIDHAKLAGVEIMVAINKIDLPGANPELVKQQLSEQGLVPEEWGGQIIMVPVSAKFKQGIDDLLEQLILVADILDLKANYERMAEGAIIEARLDKGRGPLATALIKRGTLEVGDYIVVGRSWGHIRQMTDEDGVPIEHAGPSTPVLLSGLSAVPAAGDNLNEVKDEKTARDIFEKREMDHRQGRLQMVNTISLEDFYEKLAKGETRELNIILKADLQGSIEAIRGQLENLSTDEVGVKFIHTSVGNITDSDVMLAMAAKAVIIGFNVVASPEIVKQAAMEGIDIRVYNIIYKVIEDIHGALEGLLEPEFHEQIVGKAEVRQIFKRTGKLVVAGLFVNEGKLIRGYDMRIMRDSELLVDMKLGSLKRFKDDVREVENGYECGIMLDSFTDLREGDEIVIYETIKVLRTLESTRKEK